MQLRFESKLTVDEYLTQRAWETATLACPLHPGGGCGVAGHGTYVRKWPMPIPIARFYCAKGHTTFSLLPDFLASRLPGTLDEVEEAAVVHETAPSLAKAAEIARPADDAAAVTSVVAQRWVALRVALVAVVVRAVVGLVPDLAGVRTVGELRVRLGTTHALVALRERMAGRLSALPPPLGFGPRVRARRSRKNLHQHDLGPDPPAVDR